MQHSTISCVIKKMEIKFQDLQVHDMTLPIQSCGYIHRSKLKHNNGCKLCVHDGHLLLHITLVSVVHLVRDMNLDSYLVYCVGLHY